MVRGFCKVIYKSLDFLFLFLIKFLLSSMLDIKKSIFLYENNTKKENMPQNLHAETITDQTKNCLLSPMQPITRPQLDRQELVNVNY